jgi:hypothetical protein
MYLNFLFGKYHLATPGEEAGRKKRGYQKFEMSLKDGKERAERAGKS